MLLEKEPEKRTLTIPEISAHVQNYIEGVEREFRPESLWSGVLWVVGAMALFAFLVWYVTGESIAAIFVLAPATVFNAIGWFLVTVAVGYPLWSNVIALRVGGEEHGRFHKATDEDLFVSGFLAHRTFAAALTPVFQLAFIGELGFLAALSLTRGDGISADFIRRLESELRAGWGRALIVLLVFLFAYLFCLYREVKFARRIDRYETIVVRSRWEASWPMALIGVLLLTLVATKLLDWFLVTDMGFRTYVREAVFGRPIDIFDMVKTLVFQGTFLMGLVFATVFLAFPVAEVLAALRLPYQPADEAAVKGRAQYFLRSLAVFRVARVNWLYGGAMIGGLTALTILSKDQDGSLLEQILYVLGPSLIGYAGYAATRRQVHRLLRGSPAIRQMVDEQVRSARKERLRVRVAWLSQKRVQSHLFAAAVPLLTQAGGTLAKSPSELQHHLVPRSPARALRRLTERRRWRRWCWR